MSPASGTLAQEIIERDLASRIRVLRDDFGAAVGTPVDSFGLAFRPQLPRLRDQLLEKLPRRPARGREPDLPALDHEVELIARHDAELLGHGLRKPHARAVAPLSGIDSH